MFCFRTNGDNYAIWAVLEGEVEDLDVLVQDEWTRLVDGVRTHAKHHPQHAGWALRMVRCYI